MTGPRAVGKTTTCVAETERRGGTVVRLDDPDERAAVAADPAGYLSGLAPPVLIDEYQRVPVTLDVVKLDLSRGHRAPGRWLLSGSVSIKAVAGAAESLGGRLTDVTMGTLTVDERNDRPEPTFLARLLAEGVGFLGGWRPESRAGRGELLAEAVRGGFPLVTDRDSAASQRRGLLDWVNASVVLDGAAVGGVRNVENLRRMLRLYASATASITPKDRPTADRLEINRHTVAAYRDLLAGLHVMWGLPALVPGNATGQVTKSPKLHLIDSGLAAALTGRDHPESLSRDPQFSGALVETMVANDLRVQAGVHESTPRLFHFREDSHEVDLVVEVPDGRVIGIEVKLTSSPDLNDLAGLRRLRRSAGKRWAAGVALCRVPAGRLTDDGTAIVPLDAVWGVTG
ncbi:MAG: DUF4143 domain-containing protein [Micromonosporaceae bacterium]|nr:DUF4143 domain-containing protein [Micromonosporaceae bacterium]